MIDAGRDADRDAPRSVMVWTCDRDGIPGETRRVASDTTAAVARR